MMARLKTWFHERWGRIDWNDVSIRAGKTFWQAGGAAVFAALWAQDWEAAWTLAIPAGAAALSVVYNALRQAFTAP